MVQIGSSHANSPHRSKRNVAGRCLPNNIFQWTSIISILICVYLWWYTLDQADFIPLSSQQHLTQLEAALRKDDRSPPTRSSQATNITKSVFSTSISQTNSSSSSASTQLDQVERHEEARVSTAKKITTVAFVVTITGCGDEDPELVFPITEGAAILKYSIHRNSIHGPARVQTREGDNVSAVLAGRYDYRMFAMYHPVAKRCVAPLKELNYTLLERDVPVPVNEIQGQFLRERIVNNGCCGEKELIKFEAFAMVKYPVVVLLDLDVLILKPLDNLFDLILHRKLPPAGELLRPELGLPADIDVLHTIDYEMVSPDRKIKPFQGGFAILRPNMTIYDEVVAIVRKGDFREHGGWGGKTGKFWGGMTFQGLMAYYFHVLYPGRSVELNSCIYNNMCSPARTSEGKCYNQIANCTDCREQPIFDVAATHFTICQKPWLCQSHSSDEIAHRLCRKLHHEWFVVRSEMEQSWGRPGYGSGAWNKDQFMGFCTSFGKKGYLAIQKPYGQAFFVDQL